jgi:hypothetical protein
LSKQKETDIVNDEELSQRRKQSGVWLESRVNKTLSSYISWTDNCCFYKAIINSEPKTLSIRMSDPAALENTINKHLKTIDQTISQINAYEKKEHDKLNIPKRPMSKSMKSMNDAMGDAIKSRKLMGEFN